MREPKPSPVAAWMPTLTDVAFLMPALFLFLRLDGLSFLLQDGDTGYHIRAGEWMLDHGRVLDHDIFSYTKPGEPWMAWEWLWDVTFAWLHRQWGMAAVTLVSLLVISVTTALLYRLTRRQSGNAVIAIGLTFLAAAAGSIHWLARPHLFTLLFVVIFYCLLERVREGRERLLLWLPLLTVPWVNLHGGFFVGIVLVLAYAAGELVSAALEPEAGARREAARRGGRYLLTAAGCAVASLVNPFTWRLHAHILGYFTDSYHFENITEFLSLNFHHVVGRYVEGLILLGVAGAAWSVYRRRFSHALLVAGWMHLALLSARNIPIFAIVTAPVAAWALREWLERLDAARVAGWVTRTAHAFRDFSAGITAMDRLGRVPATSAAAGVLLMMLAGAASEGSKLRAEYDPKRYPTKALEALRLVEGAGPVFAHDEWGDYLIYRLHPQLKVFVDGRSDFYGGEFNRKYVDLMNGQHDWEKTLERYTVQTVLLPVKAPLASTLKESARWRVVYDDGVAIAFRRAARAAPRAGCLEDERVSAAVGSGVIGDRLIAKPNHRDRRITTTNIRREPND